MAEENKTVTPPENVDNQEQQKQTAPESKAETPKEEAVKPYLSFKTEEDANKWSKQQQQIGFDAGYQKRESEYLIEAEKVKAEEQEKARSILISEIEKNENLVNMLNNAAEGWKEADTSVIESYKKMFDFQIDSHKKKNPLPAPEGVIMGKDGFYDVDANMKRLLKERKGGK